MKLFKYPCVKEKAQFNPNFGHSSHVTGVKFTANDTFVISTGGNDKTVMVWDTDINDDDKIHFDQERGHHEEHKGAAAAQSDSEDDQFDFGDNARLDDAKESR